jgi:hypothetical protein
MNDLDYNDLVLLSRALYWYIDRVSNTERQMGRDDSEWDRAMWLKQKIAHKIEQDAFI